MSLVSRCVKQFQNKCSFSIDHILNVAGEKNKVDNFNVPYGLDGDKKFDWLNCTRYRPPKLQRQRKRDGIQRRKLGRNPRIPFSSSQVAFLEAKFIRTPYLSSSDVTQLAANLQLSETRVKIWFQNRRARERRDRETRSKATEAQNEPTSQSTGHKESCPLENMFIEECLIPASPDRGRLLKDQQIDFYNSIRGMHLNEMNNYVQILTPLDLSERQLLCK